MVMKTCIICGKEFDARRSAKCCSSECSKENDRERKRKWHEANREKERERKRKWREANPEYAAQWREANPEYAAQRHKEIVSELCEQYDGDLEKILENIPSHWQEREAKMRVWFGESYYDGIVAKIKTTPVCEVSGERNNLVIHHLYSFNTHPELGNDPANMVRINADIHKAFHKAYGFGNNTPEQWVEFLENNI